MKSRITVEEILTSYDASAPLAAASTIPAPWYVDERIAELERQTVFSRTWQVMGRLDQVEKPGQFVTATVAGEPIVAVRGNDGVLRAFYNVCRHHAAAVATEPCGQASMLHCPYHGWNYGLDGSLKGMPEFEGVKNFERKENGLVPVKVDTWEQFVFVNLDPHAAPLSDFLGALVRRTAPLGLSKLHYFTTKVYDIHCNWKVFVDNYLDGGYHVPHLHKGLNSVLDYKQYTIENEDRYSLQSSPLVFPDETAAAASTRKGDRAWYFWQYPNFMINYYEGYLDTNLVIPIDVDHCRVIFDFSFGDVSESKREFNERSVATGAGVQDEDLGICEAVQRGLKSRAYGAGRLSVRREAGEHLFHRLLAADLKSGLRQNAAAADQLKDVIATTGSSEALESRRPKIWKWVALAFILVVGFAIYGVRAGNTDSWPQTNCTVTSSRVVQYVVPPPGRVLVMYRGEYELRYNVGGRDYFIWANAGWSDPDRRLVQDKVDDLPKVCAFKVRYNPRNPADGTAIRE